jgi:DNA-directed RNA polymerase subunit RPC12/RpoP
MGIGESQYYSYVCQDCNFQTNVEDIVIDAFIAGSIEKDKMPEIGCLNCNGTLVYLGD